MELTDDSLRLVVRNERDTAVRFTIAPWAEECPMPAGATFEIFFQPAADREVERVKDDNGDITRPARWCESSARRASSASDGGAPCSVRRRFRRACRCGSSSPKCSVRTTTCPRDTATALPRSDHKRTRAEAAVVRAAVESYKCC